MLVEISGNPIFKKKRYSGWVWILELPFCLWKALLKLGRIQFFYKNSCYNPGHNILALLNNLVQVEIATSKTRLDI